jgi:phenylpropionate dioxygenase-like ring-hydroxylating dioxygenase large terminal subunit
VTGVLTANGPLKDHWYAVARVGDLQRGPIAVQVLGVRVAVWRGDDGELTAVPDRCPHREAPLSAGEVRDGRLVCAYHGWTFAPGGRCVDVPSAREGVPTPPRAHLRPFGCEERYGLVWICVGEPKGSIPAMPWEDDPSYRRINPAVEQWRTSTPRMTDNFLDITHFPYVHRGTFGRNQDPHVPKLELGRLDDEFYGYRYTVEADNTAGGSASTREGGEIIHREMTTGFHLPFDVRSTIRYDSGLEHILLLLSTPVDDETSLFTFVVWRNDDFSVPADEVIAFDLAIGAEDKRMLERVPGLMPLDQTTLVSVQADKCSVEWCRQLAALMRAGDELGGADGGNGADSAAVDAVPVAVTTST